MSVCLQCGGKIPATIVIDGKTRNLCCRKRCLTCSPFGKHNTSKINSAREGETVNCGKCNKSYVLVRSKGHRSGSCASCFVRKRHHGLKLRALEYKGKSCYVCGYNRCVAALKFHHIDESTKKFTIGGAYNRSWESIKMELDKCVVLCGNCHDEIHYTGKSVEDFKSLYCSGSSMD